MSLRGDVATTAQTLAENAVASLEAIRASETIDAALSASLRDQLADLYASAPTAILPGAIDTTFAETLVTLARDIAAAMDPKRAVAAFAALADGSATPAATSAVTVADIALSDNARLMARLTRVAALAAYADAIALVTFEARPDAITARADAVGRFGDALDDCATGADGDLYEALSASRAAVVRYLSQAIADARPVITVTSPSRMPALWWSQKLYGSADFADDLASRNKARHAGFLPETIEALAP